MEYPHSTVTFSFPTKMMATMQLKMFIVLALPVVKLHTLIVINIDIPSQVNSPQNIGKPSRTTSTNIFTLNCPVKLLTFFLLKIIYLNYQQRTFTYSATYNLNNKNAGSCTPLKQYIFGLPLFIPGAAWGPFPMLQLFVAVCMRQTRTCVKYGGFDSMTSFV